MRARLGILVLLVLGALSVASHSVAQSSERAIELHPHTSPRAAFDLDARRASQPDDAYWDDRFGVPGANGSVLAITPSGNDVYVGGSFTTVGGILAKGIAKWNTTTNTWSALGDGIGLGRLSSVGSVYTIAVSGNDVYVGGSFLTAGSISANHIAKWNTTTQTWSALGSGTDGTVNAIAVSGTDVYVGGYFTTAGGVSARSIAKWDTTTNTWSALGDSVAGTMVAQSSPDARPASTPVPTVPPPTPPTRVITVPPPPPKISSVNAIAISGNDVYVGGNFVTAGSVTANGIAKWNTATQTWSALGSGIIGTRNYPSVNAIAISGSNVYVGGSFSAAGGVSASGIAKWDTTTQTWSALGNGIGGRSQPTVYEIAVDGNAVYVGGDFLTAGSVAANNIARWDESTSDWSALGSGTSAAVTALGIGSDGVYAGGSFERAGTTVVAGIARWSAGTWSALDASNRHGIVGYVHTIARSGDVVYVGGTFTTVGNVRANRVARWNGSAWSALGDGVDGKVLAIAISGNDVYVGGNFTSAGGVSANNIARWNATTQTWSALGDGAYGSVNAIAVRGDDVYVGGDFTSAGGVSTSRIAKWNATTQTWSTLGAGVGGGYYYPQVYALAVSGDNVYVGGDFVTAGNVVANRIAKWNATTHTWSALGSGVSDTYGSIIAIAVNGNAVYVGGTFTSIGGTSANNVAKWNGTTWSAVGSGTNKKVNTLSWSNGNLYAGGEGIFSNASFIARWDGCVWSPLGSGVNDSVSGIVANGDEVYVVGMFTVAGDKPSNHIARWNKPTAPTECHIYYFPLIYR